MREISWINNFLACFTRTHTRAHTWEIIKMSNDSFVIFHHFFSVVPRQLTPQATLACVHNAADESYDGMCSNNRLNLFKLIFLWTQQKNGLLLLCVNECEGGGRRTVGDSNICNLSLEENSSRKTFGSWEVSECANLAPFSFHLIFSPPLLRFGNLLCVPQLTQCVRES